MHNPSPPPLTLRGGIKGALLILLQAAALLAVGWACMWIASLGVEMLREVAR